MFSKRRFGRPAVLLGIAVSVLLVGSLTCSPSALGQDAAKDPSAQSLSEALANEPGLRPETKAALEALARDLEAQQATTAESEAASSTPGTDATWQKLKDNLKVSGDFRARHESNMGLDSAADRHRERLRLRLGAEYKLSSELKVGARLITGNSDDPNSSHHTMSNVFNSLEFSLDRAYLTYEPNWASNMWLKVGKFPNFLQRSGAPVNMVWDADVQPEGGLIGFSIPLGGVLENLDIAGGEYFILEQSRDSEATMTVGHLGLRFNFSETVSATFAANYYWYEDPTPDAATAVLGDNNGNATVDTNGDGTADDFQARFGLLHLPLRVNLDVGLPLIIGGDYIINTRRGTDGDNQGWVLGIGLGTTKEAGAWSVDYQYQIIEREAVFSAFAQDDLLFSTNHRSHQARLSYWFTDWLQLRLWGSASKLDERIATSPTNDADHDQYRGRLDLDIRF